MDVDTKYTDRRYQNPQKGVVFHLSSSASVNEKFHN
jgi:hypothetical protein